MCIRDRPNTLLCTFGDMLRVPGSSESLLSAKSAGAQVRIVYSPMDALEIARANPDIQVVFFAVGFETTAPANAMPVYVAEREGIENFSLIVSHVLVAPAMRAVLSHPECRIEGFLAAGHVCSITGYEDYFAIARESEIPIVVTGFEPIDLLEGISRCIEMINAHDYTVSNQYARSVTRAGNQAAQEMLRHVFTVTDMDWRGIGTIGQSGLRLADAYQRFDAEHRFAASIQAHPHPAASGPCLAGQVLQGLIKPPECPLFGTMCRPDKPLGAPMVSSEGACAAYYHYGAMQDAS